jgi:hypothetical protein
MEAGCPGIFLVSGISILVFFRAGSGREIPGTREVCDVCHIEGRFRDLFSCTIFSKDFPEIRVNLPGVPGNYIPGDGEHVAITARHTFK